MYVLGMFAIGLAMFLMGWQNPRPFWHWFDMLFGIVGMLPLTILVTLGTIMVTLLLFFGTNGEQPPEEDL